MRSLERIAPLVGVESPLRMVARSPRDGCNVRAQNTSGGKRPVDEMKEMTVHPLFIHRKYEIQWERFRRGGIGESLRSFSFGVT